MELLAPAGNMEQALSGIDAGADALYGGLKNWSARKRATNFSRAEYSGLLDRCHASGVAFYLTLNTLYLDDEIYAIRELFHSEFFPLPDAIIACDIGLITVLHKDFPSLPIHASTQFGAYTLDSLRFLEKLGVERAILARELTLSEIKKLHIASNIDIEVFVFGSQCVSFSGLCLWGGLLHGSSGNRGNCIGMCRDVYQYRDRSGQFLYPQDINAAAIIQQLEDAGVSSLKIEGRLRSADETGRTIRMFRNALERKPGESNFGYYGYLQDEIPVKGMLHESNPRAEKRKEKKSTKEHDVNIIIRHEKIRFTVKNMNDYVIETDEPQDIIRYAGEGTRYFIFCIRNIKSLNQILELNEQKKMKIDITYKLPLLDFNGQLASLLKLLQNQQIMITTLSHIEIIKGYNFKSVCADYTVNVWNKYAADFLRQNGITSAVIHPELSFEYGKHLFESVCFDASIIVYGKIPLGVTRACFCEIDLCSKRCGNDSFTMLNFERNYDAEVFCDNDFGYRTIKTTVPVFAGESAMNHRGSRITKRIILSNSEGFKTIGIPIYRETVG
jgi:collagenase-like PrtC family protease